MRVFLAVFPPSHVQAAAAAAIGQLRRPDDRVSWVKDENLHYTLRFLGDVGASGAKRAAEAAAEAAASHRPFEAALGTLGGFPDPRRARVLWLGLAEGATPLEELARDLERSLARRGFAPEKRRFTAHLTLGRVRDEGRDRPGRDWTDALAGVAVSPARWRVDRILLIRSTLSPRGSRYEPIAGAPLGGKGTP